MYMLWLSESPPLCPPVQPCRMFGIGVLCMGQLGIPLCTSHITELSFQFAHETRLLEVAVLQDLLTGYWEVWTRAFVWFNYLNLFTALWLWRRQMAWDSADTGWLVAEWQFSIPAIRYSTQPITNIAMCMQHPYACTTSEVAGLQIVVEIDIPVAKKWWAALFGAVGTWHDL